LDATSRRRQKGTSDGGIAGEYGWPLRSARFGFTPDRSVGDRTGNDYGMSYAWFPDLPPVPGSCADCGDHAGARRLLIGPCQPAKLRQPGAGADRDIVTDHPNRSDAGYDIGNAQRDNSREQGRANSDRRNGQARLMADTFDQTGLPKLEPKV
jgi:hypothetical protein